jgi:hypothetical protein
MLSFWDRLSEAHGAYLSWRRWVRTPRIKAHATDQRLIVELDALLQVRVCWYGYLAERGRDRHVDNLFDLLSNELNSGQINNLLEPVERRLLDTPDNLMPRHPVSYQYFSARPQLARGPATV